MNKEKIAHKLFLACEILQGQKFALQRDVEYPLTSDFIEIAQAKSLITEVELLLSENETEGQSIGDVAVFINQKFKYILKMNSEKKVEVAPSSGNIANALLCAVNSSDTLLELYRDYTDKEKLHWIIRDYKTLEKKFRNVVLENKNLKAKNEKLNKRIKEDDLQYPSQLNGEKYVSVKAYFKLRERYKQMEDRFWEVMQELNNLKSNSDCERL